MRPATAVLLLCGLLSILFITIAASAQQATKAQTTDRATRAKGETGGKENAPAPAGIAACLGCHGARGEGNAALGYPRLAGQPREYLARQLQAYADGSRDNPVMTPLARQLDDRQREEAATAFATMPVAPSRAVGKIDARGERLATVGDEKRQLQACANCHGPQGVGQPPGVPALAGQPRAFLTGALRQWNTGVRNTDASGQMPAIARALSDADVAAVARYYAALPAGPVRKPTAPPAPPASPDAFSPPPPPPAGTGLGAPSGGGSVRPDGPVTNAPGAGRR